MYLPALVTAIIASFPSWADGKWVEDQVSARMCDWSGLRAAQLGDTAYLDGGHITWVAELANGTILPVEDDGNPLGLIYILNFGIPFDSKTNITSILQTISKGANGEAVNNLAPNYEDGAMLANDHEFILYGGLSRRSSAGDSSEDKDDLLGYRVSDYGIEKENPSLGFFRNKLNDGITRYVTFGGAANAPSENKAWYFGGYRSPSWGPVYQPGSGEDFDPTDVSNTLLTLDLSKVQSETWTNDTHLDGAPSRANPSVVWVPVGKQGILVVLGGVSYPQYSNGIGKSANEAQSRKVSPGYMSNIDVYDVASGHWYQQPTTNPPPQLARGCAVVAWAKDLSSYNIYYYGGYDGLDSSRGFNDDVWVLSLPSFTWTKISEGNSDNGVSGHQCLTPYPDQMVVVGGSRSAQGSPARPCLSSPIRVFNLTDGRWLSSYDPSVWNTYGVPSVIYHKIGGDHNGGATLTAPQPSWGSQALASVFAQAYPTSRIPVHFPYASQGAGNGERGSLKKDGGGGIPSWVGPVLGVVLGLIFVTAIVVGILLYRRRNLLKKSGRSENSGDEYHHRIRKWLNTTAGGEKVPTEDPSSRYDEMESRNVTPMPPAGYSFLSTTPGGPAQHEMPFQNQRFELSDTSRYAELSSDIQTRSTQPHSRQHPHPKSPHSIIQPSSFAGSVSQDQPSSRSSSRAGISTAAAARERPDSPSLGDTGAARAPPPNRDAIVSDMSRISEHHMSHLRNLSGGTVSLTSNTGPSPPSTPPPTHGGFGNGPISPPLPSPPTAIDDNGAGDYLGGYGGGGGGGGYAALSRGQGPGGSLRTSVFRENSADLGESSSQAQAHTR